MTTGKIEISTCLPADHPELLRLLLELHSTYFFQIASFQNQEINQEKDLKKSYESYPNFISKNKEGTWLALLAKSAVNHIVGFIIGSIETNDDFVWTT